MNDKDHPQTLRDIAAKDVSRLCESFYKAAGRTGQAWPGPRADNEIIIAQGRGPELCVTLGYGTFKASYHKAAAEISALVVPYLTGTEDRLDMAFVSCFDSLYHCVQPSAHAVWRIYRIVKP